MIHVAGVGAALPVAARRKASRRTALQPVRAYLREWPDQDFIEEVKEAFPDKGVATVEEARVILSSHCLHECSGLLKGVAAMLATLLRLFRKCFTGTFFKPGVRVPGCASHP